MENIVYENHCFPPLSVCIKRGKSGGYGWEIRCVGEDKNVVLKMVEEIDLELREKYLKKGER
jgi:hypothetical protein